MATADPREYSPLSGAGRAALLAVSIAGGCVDDSPGTPAAIGEPVLAGAQSPDRVLAAYLETLHGEALAAAGSGEARGRLGMAYEINGLPDAAARSYEQAAALDPAEFLWPYSLGLMAADRGDLEEGLTYLDQASALDPTYLPTWLWRGSLLLDLDRPEEALAAFAHAQTLAGDSPEPAVGQARALMRIGRHQEAVEALEPLAARHAHPYLHRLLGTAYRALGRAEDAEIALQKGHFAEPVEWYDERRFRRWEHVRSVAGMLSYAQLLQQANRNDEALAILESARERDPDNDVLLNNLSFAYSRAGRAREGAAALRHALEINPNSFSSHVNLANYYLSQRREADALSHLRRAVEISPSLTPAHEMMGEILMRQDRHSEALAAFEQARSPKGYYYMAMLQGVRENWDEAIELFERSVALDPADPKTFIYYSRSLAEAGRLDEARSKLLRAHKLGANPNDFSMVLALISRLERGR